MQRVTLQCARCHAVLTSGPADPRSTWLILCMDCQPLRHDPTDRRSGIERRRLRRLTIWSLRNDRRRGKDRRRG